MKVPCYKCDKRHEGCHAECDIYKVWQMKHSKALAEQSMAREAARTVLSGKLEYLDRIAVREKRRGRRIR